MRRIALLSALVVAAAAPLRAQVANFAAYRADSTTEYQATIGAPVTSGGLDFYEFYSSSSRNVLASWGTNPAKDAYGANSLPTNLGPTAATMFATTNQEIDIFAQGDDPINGTTKSFNLYSIDVAHLLSGANIPGLTLPSFNLTFYGSYLATGATISQTFTIPAVTPVGGVSRPVLTTLTFDSRWRGMDNVYWNQAFSLNTSHQFTNVAAVVTPEPGTYLLLATGLAGVAVVARRRRSA